VPDVVIRGVPADVLNALEHRAARNNRSLHNELLQLLIDSPERRAKKTLPPLALNTASPKLANPDTTWPREEIYGDDGR